MSQNNRPKTFFIAEIGINHNGDIEIAKQLINGAADARCHAIKFQKRTINEVYTQKYLDSPRESPWGTTQREQKEGLEFGKKEYDIINQYCQKKGIDWFASAWDIKSQKFLRQYNCKYNKIASPMLTYLPLLKMVAGEGKHTFISTGMSTLEEIQQAVDIFKRKNCSFELMHCNSTYPLKNEDANLKTIETLRKHFQCNVGYSGHESGRVVSLSAVVLGTTSIERHITLDRTMYGTDQAASLEISDLKRLIEDIRTVENALGDGIKRVTEAEKTIQQKIRRY